MSAVDDPWDAGTYDGAERVLRREVAALTPDQRMQWLDDALRLALASGALQRARQLRQLRCDELWANRAS